MKLTEALKTNVGAISSALYVSVQLLSNVLSTKIAVLPFLNLSIDGGTVIYPLAFTLRDFVHKSLGKEASRVIIILAAFINIAMVLLFILVSKMSPDPSWPYQQAYEQILLPVFRITVASIVAQVISELVDTEIFSFVYKKYSDIKASLASNTVALLVDSVLFASIAFLGALPLAVVGQIIITNILIKLVMSLVVSPTVKLIPRNEAVKI